jgi:hypothetical protein
MSVLPRALLWQRVDTNGNGAEFTAYDDRRGLVARGAAICADPIPYACRYELVTDPEWVSTRFEATVEGAGWLRTVRMERAAGRWRVTTAEQGNLEALVPSAPCPGSEEPSRLADALDVDLYDSPLTNTLPIRRLGLAENEDRDIDVAYVDVPSLTVTRAAQRYTRTSTGYRYEAGSFTADLTVDAAGLVTDYADLWRRG